MSNLLKIGGLIVLAAICAFVLRSMFIVASRPAPEKPSTMERVRIATADLPAGLLLRSSDLAWKDVPRTGPPDTKGDVKRNADNADVVGDVLRHPIVVGAPVTPDDVIKRDAPGFLAAALQPGMRAVSVAVDDVSSNAGLIQPGDYVDLLLTRQLDDGSAMRAPGQREVAAETIVSHIRVLAVGADFHRAGNDSDEHGNSGNKADTGDANARPRTVTLEVDPRTAEVISVASHLGFLSLALRSFAIREAHAASDNDAVHNPLPVYTADVSRASHLLVASPLNAQPRGIAPQVRVYRGSTHAGAPAGETSTHQAQEAVANSPYPGVGQ